MKVFFVSLGCDKNLVDSEMMLGQLNEAGHEITDYEEDADVVVINSCAFIGDAKEESIENIINYGNMKTEGKIKGLVVCGCLAERYTAEIRESLPEVDVIIGTMAIDKIVEAVSDAVSNNHTEYKKDISGDLVYGKKRLLTTGGHFAYLKIAEGCGKCCTYCAIPKMRGAFRSVPKEVLIKEAIELTERGVKELILVAQETTLYGVDLYGEKSLHILLRELSEVSGIQAIRLLYCYPEEIYNDLINEIKVNKKVLNYLDMPIQSASDNVLKKMGRLTKEEDLRNIISKLRKEIPDICIRTTLISGFPGERIKDHKKTLKFVKDIQFDRLGVFTYSREEGTPAADFKNQVPSFIKKKRQADIMKAQQKIAFDKAFDEVGKTMEVMVEGFIPEEGVYVTRTYKDAPNVDGYLFLETKKELMSGDYIKCVVTGADKYDLMGVPTDEFTK